MQHLIIPKPQYLKTLPLHPCGSFIVSFILSSFQVLPSIKFNNQLFLYADEIDNVFTHGVLPTELNAIEVLAPEISPQKGFGICLGKPQFFS